MVIVCDKMQQGYSYEYTAKEGQDFAPEFMPELIPQKMLELGVFEGHYMTDCQNEFPACWFKMLNFHLKNQMLTVIISK